MCPIKTEVERRCAPEGEPTIGIINVGRTETQIGEEDVDIRESQQADRAKIFMNEADLPLPPGEVSCSLCEIFLVSIDADELPVWSDMRKEGTGVTTEPHGCIEDGFSFSRSEDPENLFLKDRSMVDGGKWLYILILSCF